MQYSSMPISNLFHKIPLKHLYYTISMQSVKKTDEEIIAIHLEDIHSISDGDESYVGIDVGMERRMVRKIDSKLLPISAVIHLLCYLDKSNIDKFIIFATVKWRSANVFECVKATQRFWIRARKMTCRRRAICLITSSLLHSFDIWDAQ
ncbi:hypothetical protein BU25DRAFT_108531 [Macroventuria anomochaeta]|uniref:Uncharacterized protein n=1 Tax=Macroventuria anomochaeta TaxID=301207 RepID=A0ACB6RUE3_9PLEO|nr:uncharacterized protein BU25DRAFT_108531 [Macroventuria anomochaeta]KAF2625671.1 hypothetical protein BU25DRAFT_108531 [Macroventuria anomochaeta]